MLLRKFRKSVSSLSFEQDTGRSDDDVEACIKGGVTAIEHSFHDAAGSPKLSALSRSMPIIPTSSSAPVRSSCHYGPHRHPRRRPVHRIAGPGCEKQSSSATAIAWPSCRGRRPSTASLRPWNTALTSSKIFPGEILGMRKPSGHPWSLPQAPLMPTGGVNVENAGDWMKAGCVAVGAARCHRRRQDGR